ncbi:MAG: hypothetical protein LBT12_03860 [Oscillospiraceae bacterium]|jgi:hypothetical protein|nr:hypothetical protein [Oscillospiraceae bacterium]
MFTETIIQKLKQNNVSVNAEKTKQRAAVIWKSAAKDAQQTVLKLSGVVRASMQRAYKTGNISAKLVIPLAQTFNIDPFYIIGETDEAGECTDALLAAFLKQHKYDDLLKKAVREEKRAKKKSEQATAPDASVESEERFDGFVKTSLTDAAEEYKRENAARPGSNAGSVLTATQQSAIDALTEDDLILLLKSVLLRASADPKYAKLAARLKLLLLTQEA